MVVGYLFSFQALGNLMVKRNQESSDNKYVSVTGWSGQLVALFILCTVCIGDCWTSTSCGSDNRWEEKQ